MRATAILFLGVVVFLGGCTDLNVTPRVDGEVVLDAELDAFDAALDGGAAGVAGYAGAAAGGIAGTSPSPTGGAGGEGGGGGGGAPAGGAGGGARAGAGGQAPGAGGNGGRGGAAAGGRPGTAGGTVTGAGGATASGGGGAGGIRGGGGTPGSGGATAGCPSTTVSPCVPNKVDTQQEACCEKGTRTHSRTCNPTTCEWGSYGAWSSCSVASACDPGKTSACPNSDSCGNRVCSTACQWGDCVPKDGNECLYLQPGTNRAGSNFRCGTGSHAGESNFCLSTCDWSNTWDNECSSCC